VKASRRKNVGREREGNKREVGNEEEKRRLGRCSRQTWGILKLQTARGELERQQLVRKTLYSMESILILIAVDNFANTNSFCWLSLSSPLLLFSHHQWIRGVEVER
jgi:hypothetical protein